MNFTTIRRGLALFAAVVASDGVAQQLAKEPIVFRSGSWEVRRGSDPMTDKVTCTGLHSTSARIQLASDGFYVGVQGGVTSVRVRYDDEPAKGLRLATEMEKKVRAVIFTGSDFQNAIRAKRVRLEVGNVLDKFVNLDVEMSGAQEVVENIRSGCPQTGAVDRPPSSKALESPSSCNEKALARLRDRGLSDKAIGEICAP